MPNNSRTTKIQVLAVAKQGPPGPPGPGATELIESKRTDVVSPTVVYKGEALAGDANPQDHVWRLKKLTITYSPLHVVTEYPNGNAGFIHSWNDRTSLIYNPKTS